jgi:hypothetical protein
VASKELEHGIRIRFQLDQPLHAACAGRRDEGVAKITVTAVIVGIVWGTMLAMMRLSSNKPLAGSRRGT